MPSALHSSLLPRTSGLQQLCIVLLVVAGLVLGCDGRADTASLRPIATGLTVERVVSSDGTKIGAAWYCSKVRRCKLTPA